MKDRDLYSIDEAHERLGGISRNTIYEMLRKGELASVVLGCRRFIAADAITKLINAQPQQPRARLRTPHAIVKRSGISSAVSPLACQSASSRRRHLATSPQSTIGVCAHGTDIRRWQDSEVSAFCSRSVARS